MCLLTYVPEGINPDISYLEAGAISNPDGFGWAIVTEDGILSRKSMNMDEALDSWTVARNRNMEGPALFHSRIATAGVLTTFNVHPFMVGDDPLTVVGHNGVLPRRAQPRRGDKRSDTRRFAELLLPKGRFGHFRSRRSRAQLENWLGTGSKLVILTANPEYKDRSFILNEHLGYWEEDGAWYSNGSYWWSLKSDQPEPVTTILHGAHDDVEIAWDRSSGKIIELGPKRSEKWEFRACDFCEAFGYIDGGICQNCYTCAECHQGVTNCRCHWKREDYR